MNLKKFQDKYFVKSEGQIFMFEDSWDSFRPVKNLAWTGKKFIVDDREFKSNIFSPEYGFGEFGGVCQKLNSEWKIDTAVELNSAEEFWRWSGDFPQWFFDRPFVFLNDCVLRDKEAWSNFLIKSGSKSRTLRKTPRSLMRR